MGFARRLPYTRALTIEGMVTHIAYQEERYRTAERCVAGIREYIDRGWDVSDLSGPLQGPFIVVFRLEDAPADVTLHSAGESRQR